MVIAKQSSSRFISLQQLYFIGVVSATVTNSLILFFLLRHGAFLRYSKQINFFHIASQQINLNKNSEFDKSSFLKSTILPQDARHEPPRKEPYSIVPKNYRKRSWNRWDSRIPIIYVITPTYQRALQKAELTRVAQTFKQIRNLHWIVVEDSDKKTSLVKNLLAKSGIKYTHLTKRTRGKWRLKDSEISQKVPIVVDQRNFGLSWIRRNVKPSKTKGVLYFADDDNTYDVRIFEQEASLQNDFVNRELKMRWTKEVSVWPVGFVGGARWAGPVCENGRVMRFHTKWHRNVPFPMDNAGFAVNIKTIISMRPHVNFLPIRERVQSKFLEKLTNLSKLEGLANDCKKGFVYCSSYGFESKKFWRVFVWSTRTEVPVANTAFEAEAKKSKIKPSYPDLEA